VAPITSQVNWLLNTRIAISRNRDSRYRVNQHAVLKCESPHISPTVDARGPPDVSAGFIAQGASLGYGDNPLATRIA
jgi:hypothetical protein